VVVRQGRLLHGLGGSDAPALSSLTLRRALPVPRAGAASPVQVAEAIIGFVSREQGAANWLSDFDPEHLRAQVGAAPHPST
jgi:hypothetical protein